MLSLILVTAVVELPVAAVEARIELDYLSLVRWEHHRTHYLAVTFLVLAASCKKNKTCECVQKYDGVNGAWEEVHGTTEIKASKKDAAAQCDALEGEPQIIFTETYWLECELK